MVTILSAKNETPPRNSAIHPKHKGAPDEVDDKKFKRCLSSGVSREPHGLLKTFSAVAAATAHSARGNVHCARHYSNAAPARITRCQNRNAQRAFPSHRQSRRPHRNALRRAAAHRQKPDAPHG